ncbi:MAG: rhomboid family intramembrane serine protease [Planctomycetaceae bacterium]
MMTLVIGCVSNYLQYRLGGVSLSQPNPQFGGISGVVFGFFGYLWFLTYFDRRQGVALQPSDSMWFFFWMLLCMTGLIGDVANVAHVSGLVVGLMLAGLGKLVRQLLGK